MSGGFDLYVYRPLPRRRGSVRDPTTDGHGVLAVFRDVWKALDRGWGQSVSGPETNERDRTQVSSVRPGDTSSVSPTTRKSFGTCRVTCHPD